MSCRPRRRSKRRGLLLSPSDINESPGPTNTVTALIRLYDPIIPKRFVQARLPPPQQVTPANAPLTREEEAGGKDDKPPSIFQPDEAWLLTVTTT